MGDWENLPEIILAEIFSLLPTTDRLTVGGVCPSWRHAAQRSEVWKSFVYSEEEFIVLSNNGTWQHTEDIVEGLPEDAFTRFIVDLIKSVGRHFKQVKLFYKGTESNQILNSIAQNCNSIVELKVQRLQGGVVVVRNHESSCKQAVFSLLQRNRHLQQLDVRDLDNVSGNQHKDPLPFGAPHALSLQRLCFLQSFQSNNLSNLMYLVNLRELTVEPHALSYSLLLHLAGNSLTDLHIVAISKHLEYNYTEALQNWQWREISKRGPQLRVHCHFGVGHEWTEKEIILKEEMPVKSMKYFKHKLLTYPQLCELVCKYSATLEEFIDISISMNSYKVAQFYADEDYNYTVNNGVFSIVQCCPRLQTLAVKEVLYSGTVLVMVYLNKNLNILLMEEQMKYSPVLPSGVNLPEDIREMIVKSSMSREDFDAAVLRFTGQHWHFISSSELYNTLFQTLLTFV